MNVAPKFLCSATFPVKFAEDCGCNTSDEVLLEQIKINITRGLPQVRAYEPQDAVAVLVCGGPSLSIEKVERELIDSYWAGGKIVAVNGAYDWCIERNIKPSAMIMIDARQFNSRFIETPVDGCRYLIASQCHPKTFELCRGRDVTIWHALGSGSDAEKKILDDYYFGHHHPVTIGTTIGVRAPSLLRMLGFRAIDVFGLDSCWLDGKHHAYDQFENDRDGCVAVWLRPRGHDELAQRFHCAPWHMKQATDFMELIRERGDMFRLSVRGPGLIATMMRTGAEIELQSKETT